MQFRTTPKSCQEAAIQLLARRDHSRVELFYKLIAKGFSEEEVNHALRACDQHGYLDDRKYAQSIIRQHVAKGHGELRIRQELKQKQVADEIICKLFAQLEIDWFELAKETAEKKFGTSAASDPRIYAKQARFLQYRGFNFEQIQYALNKEGTSP